MDADVKAVFLCWCCLGVFGAYIVDVYDVIVDIGVGSDVDIDVVADLDVNVVQVL